MSWFTRKIFYGENRWLKMSIYLFKPHFPKTHFYENSFLNIHSLNKIILYINSKFFLTFEPHILQRNHDFKIYYFKK